MKSPRHISNFSVDYLVDSSSVGDPYPEDVRKAKKDQRVVGLSQDMRNLYLLASSEIKHRPDDSVDLSPSNNVDVLASQELP